jgi:hypothetical protein
MVLNMFAFKENDCALGRTSCKMICPFRSGSNTIPP